MSIVFTDMTRLDISSDSFSLLVYTHNFIHSDFFFSLIFRFSIQFTFGFWNFKRKKIILSYILTTILHSSNPWIA